MRTAETADWITLDGAVNARTVIPGALLRSDNLQSLSPRDVRQLIDERSVEIVVDLRTDIEVELEGPGPMTAKSAVRIEHRSLYPDSGANTDPTTWPPETDRTGVVIALALDAAGVDRDEIVRLLASETDRADHGALGELIHLPRGGRGPRPA